MKLYCIATGSGGNCYILENEKGSCLLLECGVKVRDITASPAFGSWRNIAGCLITHGHADHNFSKAEIERNGINTYGYHNMRHGQLITLGDWKIKAFSTAHNSENSLGFLIKDGLSGKTIAFATDTSELPILLDVDYWLIECNYDKKTIDEAIYNSEADYVYIGSVLQYHMSLEYLETYFNQQDVKSPEKIIACHLSNNHADPARIRSVLGQFAATDIAEPGKGWVL